MGGLEDFMEEALVARYQDAPDTHDHLIVTIINSVDAHFLPVHFQFPVTTYTNQEQTTVHHLYSAKPVKDVVLTIYSPPDILQFV
jgi:hypothetical protein